MVWGVCIEAVNLFAFNVSFKRHFGYSARDDFDVSYGWLLSCAIGNFYSPYSFYVSGEGRCGRFEPTWRMAKNDAVFPISVACMLRFGFLVCVKYRFCALPIAYAIR